MKKLIQLFAIAAAASLGTAFAEETKEAAKPVNTKCPISGEDIDPEHTVAYTKVVGVCCEKCQAKLKKDVAGNLEKISKVEAKIVNSKCPMSGKAVDAEQTVMFKGAKVAFCCEKCPTNFDPEKHGEKVVMDVAGNEKCPFSGEDIDPEANAVVSFVVATCCGKCETKLTEAPDKYIPKVEFSKTEE